MPNHRTSKYASVLFAVLIIVFLTSCGRAENPAPEIMNYSLPDLEAFRKNVEAEDAEREPEKRTGTEELTYVKWIPGGVYTYRIGNAGIGDENSWSMALFKIRKVDVSAHAAVVSYVIKDMRGYNAAVPAGKNISEEEYFLSSDGIITVGCDEFEMEGGRRTIKIYLSNDRWLEFSGGNKIESAAYFHKELKYNLKSEG